jgi:hypothetical protein
MGRRPLLRRYPCNGTDSEKLQSVMSPTLMTVWCRITTLELPECDMTGQDVKNLAGVLTQCPAVTHLDLSDNKIGTVGEGSISYTYSVVAFGLALWL